MTDMIIRYPDGSSCDFANDPRPDRFERYMLTRMAREAYARQFSYVGRMLDNVATRATVSKGAYVEAYRDAEARLLTTVAHTDYTEAVERAQETLDAIRAAHKAYHAAEVAA